METQSLIVLAVVWLIVAIPAVWVIVRGSHGDCTTGEKRMTRNSAIGALAFATAVVLLVYFGVTLGW